MRVKLIGLGAAGNKASICAVENGVLQMGDVMLLNSTLKDIPTDYKDKSNCHQFVNSYGGCGQERDLSHDLCEESLKQDVFGMVQFLQIETEEEAELVIIAASTEGGTGSGAAPLIANYIISVYGIPVHVYGFAGFEDSVRGMRNTVDFFKDLDVRFAVECTKNSRFLKNSNDTNTFKAEKEANAEFCKKISVLAGLQLRDSDHNIDPTDLLKISTTEGYMIIEYIPITDKIKNKDQFEQLIVDAIDNSKALDPNAADQKRLGVMINIREDELDYINYYDTLVERFGTPYEKFEHIQHESGMPEFIAFISAGLTLPIDELEEVADKYEAETKKVNKSDSSGFFDALSKRSTDETDKLFEHHGKAKNTVSKDDFFKSSSASKGGAFGNTKVRMAIVDETDGTTGY